MLSTTQLDFWWAVNALPAIKVTSTFLEFLLVVLLTLSLVVSAALLLPSRSEDEQNGLRVYFEQNDHYAQLSLSTYFILGFTVNITFFQASPKAHWGALDIIMIVLPVCMLKAKSRKWHSIITLAYVYINAVDLAISLAR
jgi:hypothetical protein